jgi:hypothetical protein
VKAKRKPKPANDKAALRKAVRNKDKVQVVRIIKPAKRER